MKSLITVFFIVIASTIGAKAQNSINNASNNGTPVTQITPQLGPTIGVNALNTPALVVPTAPPVQVLSAPLVAPTPTITGAGVLPAIPAAPAPPPAPPAGMAPPTSTFSTTLNLPIVPMLPPIPPIPPMPDIRLPIGSN